MIKNKHFNISAQIHKAHKVYEYKYRNGKLPVYGNEYCDYLLYLYITVAEKLVIKVQYFIISEVSCITVMAYKLCRGTNYSSKYSINCT
jgi:hypothetical protein